MDIEEKIAEKVFRVAVRAAQSKPVNELQIANEILNLVRDEATMPEPEPDTACADGIAPESLEDFYRREAGRLKEQAMVHAQAAKMWEARYHDAATALERSHQEAEELRWSLSHIGEVVTHEGARANERAVYRNYDAERHTR